ncbi:MAG: SsrA-binding protein SmpB [Clostridia bacterium]|nr:SsrA-binding protein SmpB [Clostridia bacterium]
MKIIAVNKSASFEYFIEEKYEVGIVLQGNEIKSLRAGAVNMNDSFCFLRGNTVSVKNMHIAFYEKSDGFATKDTRRDRKLLLHKSEIAKIAGKINRQGYTLIPLKLYFKDALVKMELGLCKGKHTYDKKQSIAERDVKRETERAIKNAGF